MPVVGSGASLNPSLFSPQNGNYFLREFMWNFMGNANRQERAAQHRSIMVKITSSSIVFIKRACDFNILL